MNADGGKAFEVVVNQSRTRSLAQGSMPDEDSVRQTAITALGVELNDDVDPALSVGLDAK